MVRTRFLGYTGAEGSHLADIMDEAEYLITILMVGEENTTGFSEYLHHIANKFPEFAYIANEYDRETATAILTDQGREAA